MFCPKCGTNVGTAPYCPSCGQEIYPSNNQPIDDQPIDLLHHVPVEEKPKENKIVRTILPLAFILTFEFVLFWLATFVSYDARAVLDEIPNLLGVMAVVSLPFGLVGLIITLIVQHKHKPLNKVKKLPFIALSISSVFQVGLIYGTAFLDYISTATFVFKFTPILMWLCVTGSYIVFTALSAKTHGKELTFLLLKLLFINLLVAPFTGFIIGKMIQHNSLVFLHIGLITYFTATITRNLIRAKYHLED